MLDLQNTFRTHPKLKDFIAATAKPKKIGGLTNQNYIVESSKSKYVLRIPGQGTEEYINRMNEKHAAIATSAIGVNADVLYFDEKTGVQLCQFIDRSVTMSSEKFKDLAAVSRAAQSFRRVHEGCPPFQNRFELFEMLDKYLDFLLKKNVELPMGFLAIKDKAQNVRLALAKHPVSLVPCHCDPLAENFIDTQEHMYIVDWEYSGNNDPMWDLGDLSVEAGFDAAQDEVLLKSYFSSEVDPFDRGRMVMYKALCDLLWTLWGLLQHANANPVDDFLAYAHKRFQRCQNLMNTDEFSAHLQAVLKGPRKREYVSV